MRWRGRRGQAGDLNVATAALASMEQGGHAGKDGVATDSSTEEVIGIRWAPVTDDIHGELPQLEEGEG
jgi:hypothetical protein